MLGMQGGNEPYTDLVQSHPAEELHVQRPWGGSGFDEFRGQRATHMAGT